MCLSAGAMLALSMAGTAASTFMQNQAQKKQMKSYNRDVSAQNKLLSDQFTDRQKKINAARDAQGRTFHEMTDVQDAEYENQKRLAAEKQALFQDMAEKPIVQGAAAPEFQQSVDKRNQTYSETGVTPDFAPVGGESAENRVLRSSAEKASMKEKDKAMGMADALARMGAMGDVQQQQGQLFRDMSTGLTDKATEANAGSRMLDFKTRLPQYRMGAQSAVMGEQATMPYFRGTEPTYRPPNTLFADILGGASQLGSMYAFRQPGGVEGDVNDLLRKNPGGIFG